MPKSKHKLPAIFMRYRESHHALARYFALGWSLSKISAETGMPRRRIHIQAVDPTFQELVQWYADKLEDEERADRDAWIEKADSITLMAMGEIQDALEESIETGERLPLRTLASLAKDFADRTGRGPRSTHVNIDASFAVKLDAAINRSGKVTEGRPQSPPLTHHHGDDPRLIEHQPSLGIEKAEAPVEVVRGSSQSQPSFHRRKVA